MKSNHIIFNIFIASLFCLTFSSTVALATTTRHIVEDDNNRTCKITVLKYTGEPQTEVYAKMFGNINRFEADENGVITVEYDKSYTYTANIYFKNESDTYKKTISLNSEVGEIRIYFERTQDIMEYKRTARLFPIEGIVIDSEGNPIEGATVSVQGTGRKTLTDDIGLFQLEGDFNHSVNFRADGMDNLSLPITSFFKDDDDISITMNRKNSWVIYGSAEQMPEFPGGMEAFQNYLTKHLEYPTKALKAQKEGVVVVQFVVETNGSISDPRIARHLEESMDSAAWRLVKGMPNWIPASDFGAKVRCKYSLPVAFRLPKPKPIMPMTTIDSLHADSLGKHNLVFIKDSLTKEELYLDSLANKAMKANLTLSDELMQYSKCVPENVQPSVHEKKQNVFVRFFRWLFGIERRQRKRAEKELMLKVQNDSIHAVDSLVKALPKASMKVSEDSIRVDVDSLNINVKDLEKKAKELMK